MSSPAEYVWAWNQVKVAFCSVGPGLVCAQWAFHLESSAPYTVPPRSNPYKTLDLRPKIAVCLTGMWAFPDLSGTCSLIRLHVNGKV